MPELDQHAELEPSPRRNREQETRSRPARQAGRPSTSDPAAGQDTTPTTAERPEPDRSAAAGAVTEGPLRKGDGAGFYRAGRGVWIEHDEQGRPVYVHLSSKRPDELALAAAWRLVQDAS